MLTATFKLFSKKISSLVGMYSVLACKMENAKIIPDVICRAPCEKLKVLYGDGFEIDIGCTFTPTLAKYPPCVSWTANENACYVLCLTDPDAPCRKAPKFREWHHWLVGNIPGDRVAKGEVLSKYIGPAPPKDTGLHRYVFLVYKQCCKIDFTEPRLSDCSDECRALFSISKFAKKYTLDGPVAGNFFLAKYDCYVDELNKKLSGKK